MRSASPSDPGSFHSWIHSNTRPWTRLIPPARDVSDVAFTAKFSQDTTVDGEATLVFDAVELNEGGAYSTSTGIYTALYSGTYHFSVLVFLLPGGPSEPDRTSD